MSVNPALASLLRQPGKSCEDMPVEAFFPVVREDVQARALAQLCCNGCPVRAACLAYAIEAKEIGVWAGTTTDQRRRLARAANKRDYWLNVEKPRQQLSSHKPRAARAPRTTCVSGRHPWVPDNLLYNSSGSPYCRECKDERRRDRDGTISRSGWNAWRAKRTGTEL